MTHSDPANLMTEQTMRLGHVGGATAGRHHPGSRQVGPAKPTAQEHGLRRVHQLLTRVVPTFRG
jgi:hypothetical protein